MQRVNWRSKGSETRVAADLMKGHRSHGVSCSSPCAHEDPLSALSRKYCNRAFWSLWGQIGE